MSQSPLEAYMYAFSARLGNWSVFTLDPCLLMEYNKLNVLGIKIWFLEFINLQLVLSLMFKSFIWQKGTDPPVFVQKLTIAL